MIIHLTDINPKQLISANTRRHWAQNAETTAYWRAMGAIAGRRVNRGAGPLLDRAHITVWFTFPTKRRRDVANLHHYVIKPLVDGLVSDARLLPDDDDVHLVGPDARRLPVNGPHAVQIEVQPL